MGGDLAGGSLVGGGSVGGGSMGGGSVGTIVKVPAHLAWRGDILYYIVIE